MFGLCPWLFVQTSRHSGPKHFPFPACVCKDIDTCIMTKLRYTVRVGWGPEEARRCVVSEQVEIEGGSWAYPAATRVRASGRQREADEGQLQLEEEKRTKFPPGRAKPT